MSREVEVTGLNMTATVPEDLQISLGALGTAPGTPVTEATAKSSKVNLASGTGFLTYASGKTDASDGDVAAPTTNAWDWTNTVNISNYYAFGKLIPASSTNGATIYYTPDATGSGRTVGGLARYYAANTGLAENKTGGTVAPTNAEDGAKTTLHAYINDDDRGADSTKNWKTKTGGYAQSNGWDETNDDGYYIDIPVWLRSSAKDDINVKVSGYVLPGSTDTTDGKTETQLELYRAVRVAILNNDANGIISKVGGAASTVSAGSVCQANNIIPLVDAWDKDSSTKTGTGAATVYKSIATKTNPYAFAAADASTKLGILDSAIYIERTDKTEGLWGVSALSAYEDDDKTAENGTQLIQDRLANGGQKPTYTSYTQYSDDTAIATVKAPTAEGVEYGDMKALVIRVWLDGEDEECWNDNAGQDWAISLKFDRVDISST